MKKWSIQFNNCLSCGSMDYYSPNKQLCSNCRLRNRYKNDRKFREKQIKRIFKAVKKWKVKNPEKAIAHKKVFVAIRNGSLKQKDCFCGNKDTQAHHDDYFKPLEVKWLCKKHHIEHDQKRREKLLTPPIAIIYLMIYYI